MCRELHLLKSQEEDGPERKAGSTACLDSPPRIRPVSSNLHCQRVRREESCRMQNRTERGGKSFPEMGNMLHPGETSLRNTWTLTMRRFSSCVFAYTSAKPALDVPSRMITLRLAICPVHGKIGSEGTSGRGAAMLIH